MDDFLQAASAERPPSYEMLSEVCAHGVLVHDQLFHAGKAHEVLISSETINLVGIDKVSSELAFPGQRAQAQLHVGLIFYAIELFDPFDAVVVLANNDPRCCLAVSGVWRADSSSITMRRISRFAWTSRSSCSVLSRFVWGLGSEPRRWRAKSVTTITPHAKNRIS